ncbi:MAG: 4'-phosphopantetheinyl transferase superfamily protein [Chloroherpetonaceae bacterium]|nr:4'-phosphopantetheinyl transferase superfamily protein [Chthonomonadaceae bacterium]MDW8206476.1 4'-phosphopantetheinyl transferase superfamily protein [Chloroherpetonaceae bacterium]
MFPETLLMRLSVAHAFGHVGLPAGRFSRTAERDTEKIAALRALQRLFADQHFPAAAHPAELLWQRDALGKPAIDWQGGLADWAASRQLCARHLHVSNTHDGPLHLVLAAYEPGLLGVGVDLVYLPRLRRPGKDADYLRRLATRFMSVQEWQAFTAASHGEDEEALRVRVAAHFSLMEAASKALGTGLRLAMRGARPLALPPRALGVSRLRPEVRLLLGPEAEARRQALRGGECAGDWAVCGEYLISAVVLWRSRE